jgi:hypothetical protein
VLQVQSLPPPWLAAVQASQAEAVARMQEQQMEAQAQMQAQVQAQMQAQQEQQKQAQLQLQALLARQLADAMAHASAATVPQTAVVPQSGVGLPPGLHAAAAAPGTWGSAGVQGGASASALLVAPGPAPVNDPLVASAAAQADGRVAAPAGASAVPPAVSVPGQPVAAGGDRPIPAAAPDVVAAVLDGKVAAPAGAPALPLSAPTVPVPTHPAADSMLPQGRITRSQSATMSGLLSLARQAPT